MGGIYWLRAVQYYGSQRAFATDKRFENLAPLIEITNALDPQAGARLPVRRPVPGRGLARRCG